MIKNVAINGLKSIDYIKIDFRKFNILVGTNSSGKSTIIQSLLIASQNITNENYGFNGNLISLGDFRELRNFNTNAKEINIEIEDNYHKYYYKFRENENTIKIDDPNLCEFQFDKGLYYLSASRIGFLDTYEKNIKSVYKFGLQGEYCLDYYDKNKDKILDLELIKEDTSQTLSHQVNYWFHYIIGAKLETTDITQTDRLKARFIGKSKRHVRTKNMGSGLSYLISILIMALSLEKNETLIIENPEIHLHPKSQSKLVDFFTFITNANRQLIIETHSDHIFNGIRAAIATNTLMQETVSINFLKLDERECTKETFIEIGKRGRILNAPKDLFDQFDHDLDRMLGI